MALKKKYRWEADFLGKVKVPVGAYFGAQTQRAIENFPISGKRLPRGFIRAQGIIKIAAVRANMALGLLDRSIGRAIVRAAEEVRNGKWDEHFVVDVYQAGAGTSQNMNANEVIANRAIEVLGGRPGDYSMVHPNNHVNMAQSTNDTFPTALSISSLEAIHENLLPAMKALYRALNSKAGEFNSIVKPGRTHLQDAVPIRLGQEFSGYAAMVERGVQNLTRATVSLLEIPLGGTAVGTGLNAHPRYPDLAIKEIKRQTGLPFKKAKNPFELIQNVSAALEVSGALRWIAISLTKISNDLRLLSSGPRTGLAEIRLPAVQPGSSIMPGKVNPVIPEMLSMVCFQVLGNDSVIAYAVQAAQLEVNVMMPVIVFNLLDSVDILTNSIRVFTHRCIKGIKADKALCMELAERSLALATSLIQRIGYARASEIAKEAFRSRLTIREVAIKNGILSEEEALSVLDPIKMTGG